MIIHFIRHGQPDYSNIGPEENIEAPNRAPLTEKGRNQANNIDIKLFKNVKMIVSSPYQRTIETAEIIAEKLNLTIKIEENLHEWLPDKTKKSKAKDFDTFNTMYLKNITNGANYETISEMKKRLLSVIEKYKDIDEIIIVAHQRLINSLTEYNLKYCEVFTYLI